MTPVVAWAAGYGDRVVLHAPAGSEALQILEVRYQPIAVQPFTESPGAALSDFQDDRIALRKQQTLQAMKGRNDESAPSIIATTCSGWPGSI